MIQEATGAESGTLFGHGGPSAAEVSVGGKGPIMAFNVVGVFKFGSKI